MLEPLAKEAGLRIVAVYGGAESSARSRSSAAASTSSSPPRAASSISATGANSRWPTSRPWSRRGRPHGRHGLHAPGRVGAAAPRGDHQTLLFSATLDGAVDRLVSRYLTDPVLHEVASAHTTVEAMEHRFLEVTRWTGSRWRRHLPGSGEDPGLRADQAGCRPPGRAAPQGRDPGRRHPRRPPPVQPRADPETSPRQLPALVATDVAARGLDIDSRRRGRPLHPKAGTTRRNLQIDLLRTYKSTISAFFQGP